MDPVTSREMQITGRQVAAARELLKSTQAELAQSASIHESTVTIFEAGTHEPRPSTIRLIQETLERRGIEFTNGSGMGVRLDFAKAEIASRAASRPPQ